MNIRSKVEGAGRFVAGAALLVNLTACREPAPHPVRFTRPAATLSAKLAPEDSRRLDLDSLALQINTLASGGVEAVFEGKETQETLDVAFNNCLGWEVDEGLEVVLNPIVYKIVSPEVPFEDLRMFFATEPVTDGARQIRLSIAAVSYSLYDKQGVDLPGFPHNYPNFERRTIDNDDLKVTPVKPVVGKKHGNSVLQMGKSGPVIAYSHFFPGGTLADLPKACSIAFEMVA